MNLESMTTNALLTLARERAGLTYTTRNRKALIKRIQSAGVAVERPPQPETAEAMIRRLWTAGKSVREVCAALEAVGHKTPKGSATWWPSSVQMIARRLGLPVCAPKRTAAAST